ncbi:MAG: 30S ribosomal protein S18 [Elusimicrobia bacterium RIFCSPLOWO2_01_FULL_64_13]|nr:MAG: 30S ribosomal protein S18 [Elusimicrobia bacterium RIFCSPLOWO2_01_FULL_64_13]
MTTISRPSGPFRPAGYRPAGYRPAGSRPPRPGGRFGKPFGSRRKVCRFCAEKIDYIDFKNVSLLRTFVTDRGKVLSARTTGVCTYHQRDLGLAIKRARNIALLPFTMF